MLKQATHTEFKISLRRSSREFDKLETFLVT